MYNNPNLDLVSINAKLGKMISLSGNEIMTDGRNDGQHKSSIAPFFSKRHYNYAFQPCEVCSRFLMNIVYHGNDSNEVVTFITF